MIDVTVALPTWRSQHIIWLQLESLCRQETDAAWELIVYACDFGESEAIIEDQASLLISAGCVGIEYITSSERQPLGSKWVEIARRGMGNCMILAASDNYSPPDRIQLAHKYINGEGHDWFDVGSGLFFDINTRATAQWVRPAQDTTGLWMACEREKIAQIEGAGPKAGIDAWLREEAGFSNPYRYEKPLAGVHTDGANTISRKRASRYLDTRWFHPPRQKPKHILPDHVYRRLREMGG